MNYIIFGGTERHARGAIYSFHPKINALLEFRIYSQINAYL